MSEKCANSDMGSLYAATITGRLTGFTSAAAPVLAFLRDVINESISRPRSIQVTAHHINAARRTSQ
jgi:hypothetical protein